MAGGPGNGDAGSIDHSKLGLLDLDLRGSSVDPDAHAGSAGAARRAGKPISHNTVPGAAFNVDARMNKITDNDANAGSLVVHSQLYDG